jgi:hypothetical protein
MLDLPGSAQKAWYFVLLTVGSLAVAACAPRLRPLAGTPAPHSLPQTELPPEHRRIVFDWELEDRELSGRGEGVARVAPPDSARLDFFLAGGFGAGGAVLLGDTLRLPGGELGRRFVPPPPLLWGALGRVALPALPDTTARVDGALLRVDIGLPPEWRLTFQGDRLSRLERVRGGRILEWVERSGDVVRYRNEEARRTLLLTIKRVENVAAFDASIWGPF